MDFETQIFYLRRAIERLSYADTPESVMDVARSIRGVASQLAESAEDWADRLQRGGVSHG